MLCGEGRDSDQPGEGAYSRVYTQERGAMSLQLRDPVHPISGGGVRREFRENLSDHL